ncbi:GNAT family N-acetyltransferase [Paracoccus gahaiensis]|uniref:GNAT family N-acetyltransferase n=1 Tax=Paracoccus gahaiensis TaxID=1706839 RepID=A0A4U0RCL2_9RHOB|nr:GNAT family N-acetyltransferase [Paracoccus gahaiensis]TJZ92935.1 GNAT family N-acetyltransferase [Paracoccus gahaiensis]
MPPPIVLSRPWPEDAEAIAAALSDWETMRWLSTPPWPYGLADAQEFIAQASLDEYAIRLGDRLAGTVLAGRAFGLWIAPDLQGQGIGRRAGVLALSRLFLSGAEGIQSHVLLGNDRSARLLEGLGFVPQGQTTIRSRPLDGPVEATVLHLDRAGFEARHAIALTTPRLAITAITPADLPALHAIVTQPQVARMMLRVRPDMRLDEVAALLENGGLLPPLRLAVRHEGRVIGAVGLGAGSPPRLHYFLDPQLAGQGFGQEMVAAVFHELVARFAPPEIVADVFLDNPASRKILKNLGFRRAEDVALYTLGREAQAEAALYRWRPGLLP